MTQLSHSWTHTQRTPCPPTEILAHLGLLQPFHKSKNIESASMSTNWLIMKTQCTHTREFYSTVKTKKKNNNTHCEIWKKRIDLNMSILRELSPDRKGKYHRFCHTQSVTSNLQPCVFIWEWVCVKFLNQKPSQGREKKRHLKEESWARWWNKWDAKMKRRPPGTKRTQAKVGRWGEGEGGCSTKGEKGLSETRSIF